MKRLLFIFAAVFLLSVVQSVSAQDSQRIQFERGKNSATIKGTTGEYGVSYVVTAKAGQKIAVALTPASGIGIKIDTDNGGYVLLKEERGGSYEVDLDQDGDYEIFVGSTNHRSKAFTLVVKITKAKLSEI
ncbi:MAG: hypothetical protein ABI878_05665 [Acidobacteriota bacterium]